MARKSSIRDRLATGMGSHTTAWTRWREFPSFVVISVAVRVEEQGSKILGKQSLRALPIIGWCWHFTESIFLRRAWATDKAVLEHDIRQLVDNYPKEYNFTVGTRDPRDSSSSSLVRRSMPDDEHAILVISLMRRHSLHRGETSRKHENRSRERSTGIETSHSATYERVRSPNARNTQAQ